MRSTGFSSNFQASGSYSGYIHLEKISVYSSDLFKDNIQYIVHILTTLTSFNSTLIQINTKNTKRPLMR